MNDKLYKTAKSSKARWTIRFCLWLVVVSSFLLLLRYDLVLMRWRYHFIPEGPEGLLKQVLFGFRDFAQILPIVVALILVATYDKRRWRIIVAVLLAQLFAAGAYNSGKYLVARYRPIAQVNKIEDLSTLTIKQTWIGWQPGNTDSKLQSFPSGHSGAAFALAGVLAWFYPPLRWLLWTLAAGCATSRFIDAVHWPSDCMAGAIIGYLAAWVALKLCLRK